MIARLPIRVGLAFVGASLLAGSPAAALSEESSRIVRVRLGRHADFDRIVFDLDRPTEARWIVRESEPSFELRIAARTDPPQRTLGSARLGRMSLEATAEGARVLASPRGEVRVFLLDSPPRVVVDFAEFGRAPLEVPPDGRALVPESALARSEPTRAPTLEPATPVEPLPSPEIAATLPEEAPGPQDVPTPRPPAALTPEPAAPPPDEGFGLFVLGLSAVAAALLGAAAVWALSRLRARHPEGVEVAAEPIPPETITPLELASSRDRVEVLEKRLDDEVRARMQVEERLAQLHEEHKVLGDRLRRLLRRRPDD